MDKLNKENLAYNIIKQKIISNELKLGSIIDIKELQTELNISSTPIKNAFKLLEKEQFVIIKPRKKIYVKKIDLKLLKDLFQIRNKLEYITIELTILNMSEEKLKKCLLEFKNKFNDLKKHSGFNNTYNDFRFFFATNCGNIFLRDQMTLIYEHLHHMRMTLFKKSPRREEAISEQLQIIEILLKKDINLKKLKECVNSHIKKAQLEFFNNLDNIKL